LNGNDWQLQQLPAHHVLQRRVFRLVAAVQNAGKKLDVFSQNITLLVDLYFANFICSFCLVISQSSLL